MLMVIMMDVIEMMVDKQAVMVMHMEVDKVTKEADKVVEKVAKVSFVANVCSTQGKITSPIVLQIVNISQFLVLQS